MTACFQGGLGRGIVRGVEFVSPPGRFDPSLNISFGSGFGEITSPNQDDFEPMALVSIGPNGAITFGLDFLDEEEINEHGKPQRGERGTTHVRGVCFVGRALPPCAPPPAAAARAAAGLLGQSLGASPVRCSLRTARGVRSKLTARGGHHSSPHACSCSALNV